MNTQSYRTHSMAFLLTLTFVLMTVDAPLSASQAKVNPVKEVKPEKPIGPVIEVTGIKPPKDVNFRARPKDAKVIKTADEAAKIFGKEGLKALKKQVNFDKQNLVVMSWSGSGQDRINITILESFPEQVVFNYKRGRTRDLRRHFKLYALRKNVKWSVGK